MPCDCYVQCGQREQQQEVSHSEADALVQFEKGIALEIAAGKKGRTRVDRLADLQKAVGWFRAAAFQGHKKSMYKLGVCHLYGRGAPLIPDQVRLYLCIASRGVPSLWTKNAVHS